MTIHNQSMKGEFAGFASRFVAFAIDLVVIFISAGIISWVIIAALSLVGINPLAPVDVRASNFNQMVTLISKIVLALMPFALWFSYRLFFWTVTGQTIGNRAMGIRVVRMDGERMKLSNSLRRIVMYFFCMLPFFLGFLWILIDDERRGWHDKVANTCVIYAWEAREVKGFMKASQRRVRQVEERMGTSAMEQASLVPENLVDSAETTQLS